MLTKSTYSSLEKDSNKRDILIMPDCTVELHKNAEGVASRLFLKNSQVLISLNDVLLLLH